MDFSHLENVFIFSRVFLFTKLFFLSVAELYHTPGSVVSGLNQHCSPNPLLRDIRPIGTNAIISIHLSNLNNFECL